MGAMVPKYCMGVQCSSVAVVSLPIKDFRPSASSVGGLLFLVWVVLLSRRLQPARSSQRNHAYAVGPKPGFQRRL